MKHISTYSVRHLQWILLCVFLLPSLQYAQNIVSQNFDGVAVGSLPTGWKTVKKTTGYPISNNNVAVTGTTWRVDKPSTVGLATASSSPNAALIGVGVAQNACDWLFSPAVQLKAGTLYTFSIAGVANIASDPIFAYCKDVNGNGIPEPEGADATGYEEWNGIGIFGSTWASFNQSFYALESGTYFIGVQATMVGPFMSGNPYYMGIDNISVNVAAGITITAPVGGESWQNGTPHAITWTSTGVSKVDIYYSTDGGNSFTGTIATGVSAGSYTWTVPSFSSASQSIIIMIMDPSSSSPSIQTQMTQPITVTTTASKSISFIADMSGLNFPVASTRYINWTSSGTSNVKIEYSTNNGTNWTTIIGSTDASADSYGWVVPNTPSTSCKVRISDAADAAVNAVGGTFTISSSASITVTSPNGGENWVSGSQHAVTWSSSGITNVKLEYSTNSGSVWTTIIAATAASSGTYTWTIPAVTSIQCIVRVSDASNSSTYDVSNITFTITTPSITVLSPNGGESWIQGSQHAVTWSSSSVANVKIEYSTNNGTNWTTIIASTAASAGAYTWTIPAISLTQCLVRVSDASNSATYDVSNAAFSISPSSASITVTSPNGGENWLAGSTHAITWTSVSITNVKLEYSSNNGSSWTTIIASTAAISGSYTWTIPATISTQCIVRASDASNSSTNDVSNTIFTISPAASVTVTSPNGGENWLVGSTHAITWTSISITNVKLEYSSNNGSSWTTIIASTAASAGTYTWTIPSTISTQCLVRASDASNSSTNDVSNTIFTLSTPITVTNPNGGENWLVGSTDAITWTSVSVTNVKLEYSSDNGSSWTTIIASTAASAGTYTWTIPSTTSTQCLVRASDATNSATYDVSNAVFTIRGTWTAVNTGLNPVVDAFAISGTNLFAGCDGSGVFLSTNNGTNWNKVSTGLTDCALNIRALAISGTNLFAGTYNGGAFRSTDNGTSWTAINTGLTSYYVFSLAMSGTNLFAGTCNGGAFRSTNNGTSWTAVNTGLTDLNVLSLAVSGTNLFAGTNSNGVFLSTNNGTQWTAINTGLTISRVWALTFNGINLFAGTQAGGVFLSTNNGTNWSTVNTGLTRTYVQALAISGTNLFAGTNDGGVFRSTNNGTNWNAVNTGLTGDALAVYALAVSGTNLFAGTWGGAFVADISSLPLPVELTSFIAKVKQSTADLRWATTTELNNYGFEVERAIKNYELRIKNWEKIGFVGGSGTSNAPKEYYFTDKNIPAGKYSYRLKQIDRDGKFEYSQEVEVTASGAPKKFTLCQNYPNPFNPTTTLRYGIPERSTVKLTVYSTLGQQVLQVSSGTKDAGYHEYTFDASQLTSGVYLYKIEAVSEQDPNTIFVKTQKMILMK